MIDGHDHLGRETAEVFLARRDDESTHIHSAWTDDILGIALSGIAVRTVFPSRQNHGDELFASGPRDDVHHGLCIVRSCGQTMVKLLEQAFAGLSTMALDDQSGSGVFGQLPDALVLVLLKHLDEVSAQSLPSMLQRQHAALDSLQVSMIRSRGTAMRSII